MTVTRGLRKGASIGPEYSTQPIEAASLVISQMEKGILLRKMVPFSHGKHNAPFSTWLGHFSH